MLSIHRQYKTQETMNIEEIRKDFPILGTTVHDRPLVYLDNAATTQKPACVIDSIRHTYEHQNANIHRGVHLLSQRATEAHENARKYVAEYIGTESPDEIIFTRGTTESINLVATCFTEAFCRPGDEIIFTAMEHHADIVPWQMAAARHGLTLRVAPIDESGQLRIDDLFSMVNSRTRLIAVAHASNVLGTVNPISEITRRAHRAGVHVLVDGAQAIAHTAVNVRELDADFYAFSGHKVYGPNGIGVLYGKRALLEQMPPYQGGGEMIANVTFEKTEYNVLPYKYEAGTPDYVGSVALEAALRYVSGIGMADIVAHERSLHDYATAEMMKIKGMRIIGTAPEKCGVISFLVGNIHPFDIGTLLDQQGVAIRTGHHCAQPLIDMLGIPGTARLSFAIYTTQQEIDSFITALRKAITILQ